MAGGKDEYYRPWLDGIDDDRPADAEPGMTTANRRGDVLPRPGNARPKAPASSHPLDPGPSAERRAPMAANVLAGLKRGWTGFAATTIRLGERADIPARVAALELGDKARTLAGAVSRGTRKAGQNFARASIATGKASGAAIGKAGSQAGDAIGSAAARTRAATRKGFDSSVAATRTHGGKIASGAKDAARPVIARVAPPKPAAPVVGSALDRLVADENANSPAGAPNRAGDLPLFGDFSEAGADAPDAPRNAEPSAPSPVALPDAKPRGRKPKSAASAAVPPPSIDDTPETRTADASEVASDGAEPPTRRIVIGLAIIAVLVVAILAGSALWGRDGSSGSILASAPGATTAPDSGSPLAAIDAGRRAEIETVVEAYILDHPEIIPQALERLQQRESAASIAKLRPAIEQPFAGAWGGNPKGDVVVTEYSDYACTFCRRSLPDVERLLKGDPGIKIVYRELPILSAESAPAAKVGLAAARKGRYRAYHLALFALGQPSDANILTAAAKAGMTPEDVAAAKADPALDREIASNVSVAQQLRFEGTPIFVVGDQILHGAVGYDALKAAVAKARE
jgi:protein-disulfide isomerase